LLTWEQDKAAREADEERIRKEQEQQQQQQGSNEGSSSGGSSGGGSGGSAAVGKKVTFESGIYYNSSDGQKPTGYHKRGQQVYITSMNPGAPYPIHISENNSVGKGYDLGWLKENQLKFDTGGYTGEWTDNEGRMAILHKKELVLNADDTQNFLAAISMVRDMSGIFEAMNDSILSRVTGMTNALTPQAMSSGMEQNELNQNVNIQASFPGVSSRAEIEQAFANLVNMASQHAYNTRR
jgi:hypothetical protein